MQVQKSLTMSILLPSFESLPSTSCRLLIYPAMDEPALELWISSLRSTAESGFNMTLKDPSNLPNLGKLKDDQEMIHPSLRCKP